MIKPEVYLYKTLEPFSIHTVFRCVCGYELADTEFYAAPSQMPGKCSKCGREIDWGEVAEESEVLN